MQGKITECWLAETEDIFLNQEGTFGNQKSMITWCWLAEHACIKLVSRFKRILKRNFRNASLLSLILTPSFILTWKKINTQQSAAFRWKSKRIFPTKYVLIRRLVFIGVRAGGGGEGGCSPPSYRNFWNFLGKKLMIRAKVRVRRKYS